MRFLLDATLSPLIVGHLNEAGHSATHVRDIGLRDAGDEQIMDYRGTAAFRCRFPGHRLHEPAVLPQDIRSFPHPAPKPPEVTASRIAGLILANLENLGDALTKGAVASIADERIRVRRLPFQ